MLGHPREGMRPQRPLQHRLRGQPVRCGPEPSRRQTVAQRVKTTPTPADTTPKLLGDPTHPTIAAIPALVAHEINRSRDMRFYKL